MPVRRNIKKITIRCGYPKEEDHLDLLLISRSFSRNLPPSNTKAMRSFETSEFVSAATQRNIAEKQNPLLSLVTTLTLFPA